MKNFKSIESLENWLTWQYLSKLGKSPREIAYIMDVNEQRLIEWVNNRSARMNQIVKSQSGKVETIMQSLARKYREKKSDELPIPEINIKKVAKLLAHPDKYTLVEIADKLHYKPENFMRGYHKPGVIQLIERELVRIQNNPVG